MCMSCLHFLFITKIYYFKPYILDHNCVSTQLSFICTDSMLFIRSLNSIGMEWHPHAYSYLVKWRNSPENSSMWFGRRRSALIQSRALLYRKSNTTRKPRTWYSMRMFYCRHWALTLPSITHTHMSWRHVIWWKVRHFFITSLTILSLEWSFKVLFRRRSSVCKQWKETWNVHCASIGHPHTENIFFFT